METSFNTEPLRPLTKSQVIIRDIDKVLAEESELLEALHRAAEQNGTEVSEEQLVFDFFKAR